MKRLLLGAAMVASVGCGGSSSPTAPTASTASLTRVITIEGSLAFGDVTVGQTKDLTITLRNSGTGTLTLGDPTAPSSVTAVISVTGASRSIAPGGTTTMLFRFTPTTTASITGTVTIVGDQTSGTNTITLSGRGVPAPTPNVTVTGVVTDAVTRRAVGGVRVGAVTNNTALTSLASTTTDGNGFYSIVVPSSTSIVLQSSRDGYNLSSSTVTFTADTRRDISLNPLWTASGTGNTVFDMPSYVSRVRITGRYDSSSSNFVVRVGGRLVVNELLGRSWSSTTYNGLHLVTGGGVTEITLSRDVVWTFTQEQ